MKNQADQEIFALTQEYIQEEAESEIGRKLTEKELEEVGYEILEEGWKLSELVRESINSVITYNELMERNKDAQKQFPHYELYHRNENAFQPELKLVRSFKTEKDAREYLRRQWKTEDDEWRLARVEEIPQN